MKKERLMRGLAIGGACTTVLIGGLVLAACQGNEESQEMIEDEGTDREAMVEARIAVISAELDLNDEQEQRLRNVRDLVHERRDDFRSERGEFMESRLAELEAGEIDDEGIHQRIDDKIDELRGTAHQVADELIALVNGMDEEQRTATATKLRRFHERMEAFHEQMEGEGGPRAFFSHVRERICSGHDDGFHPMHGMFFGDDDQSVDE